jgi:hypothetical protein
MLQPPFLKLIPGYEILRKSSKAVRLNTEQALYPPELLLKQKRYASGQPDKLPLFFQEFCFIG